MDLAIKPVICAMEQARLKNEMEEYTNSEMANAINEVCHSERNRAILKRRLVDGILFEPLAEEFQMSVRQVKSIVYKERERIFAYMKVIHRK